MGPCKCLHAIAFRLPWANSSLLAQLPHLHLVPTFGSHPARCKLCGPMWQSCVTAHCISYGPMQANLNITVHKMGPCECLHAIAFRLLWVNLISLARSWHSHHGPMRAPFLVAIPLTVIMKAHMAVSYGSPLCTWWAKASQLSKYCSIWSGPMQVLVHICNQAAVGQCKLIIQISQCMKWAHSEAWKKELSGCCGPTQPHREGRGILIAGQCEHLSWQLSCYLQMMTLWRPM